MDNQSSQQIIDKDTLKALEIAFTFLPHPMEINRFEYGDDTDRVKAQVKFVREILEHHGIDPEEVSGDINPDSEPNSCY